MEKVQKWRKALVEAGRLSGLDLHSIANGHESKLIQMIVEEVLSKLNPRYMKVATYPVGIDSQVKDIISMLCVGPNEVRIVGIYGMPGIGKTTIAKAVFNQICHQFEGSCLLNIKERFDQHTGLLQLQKQLLRDTFHENISHHYDDDERINRIKSQFCRRRVLVILDDVDQLKHLSGLAGERDWFGPGSRIVITTRDERLLTRLEVEKQYHAEGLNNDESLQLFSWHAFKKPHPMKEYVELSKVVVDYVGGVPLALEVLGSKLFKRSITHWRSFIEKLQKHLPHQIQRQLITSLDDLDGEVKGMFLDIACFFNGMDKDYVGKILDGRGFYPEMGFDILRERSLLTVNSENELQMNNLLRDMGREIIHQMAPNHPGKRSRLWRREDIMDVLDKYCSGTEAVEGIVLDAQASKDVVPSTSFAPMTSLQLLKFSGGQVRGHYEHISKVLIWLCWHKFSLETLPHKFRLDSLVVLDMQHSNIRELWKETKCLNNLKVIDISNSRFFAKTPNFSGLPGLERLILENCASLADIHQSVGELKKLVFLNLKGCSGLKNLPESISHLNSLETMNLEGCISLKKLPEQLGNMKVLTHLLLDETGLHNLPSSTGILKKLKKLLVRGIGLNFGLKAHCYRQEASSSGPLCARREAKRQRQEAFPSLDSNAFSGRLHSNAFHSKELALKQQPFLPPSFSGLSSLTTLDISNRYLSNNDISINLGSLSSLQDLNLAGNHFSELPAGTGHLPKLEKLDLSRCRNLLFISEIPSSLRALVARDCKSLEKVSIQSKTAPDLLLGGCGKLAEIQGLESVENKPVIRMENCNNLSNNFKEILLQVLSKGKLPDVVLPGSDVPHWFMQYQRDRSSTTFRMPPISAGLSRGLIVWTVYGAKEEGEWTLSYFNFPIPTCISDLCSASIRKKKDDNELFYTRPCLDISSWPIGDHSWVIYIPFSRIQGAIEGGDELEVSVKPGDNTIVKKCVLL